MYGRDDDDDGDGRARNRPNNSLKACKFLPLEGWQSGVRLNVLTVPWAEESSDTVINTLNVPHSSIGRLSGWHSIWVQLAPGNLSTLPPSSYVSLEPLERFCARCKCPEGRPQQLEVSARPEACPVGPRGEIHGIHRILGGKQTGSQPTRRMLQVAGQSSPRPSRGARFHFGQNSVGSSQLAPEALSGALYVLLRPRLWLQQQPATRRRRQQQQQLWPATTTADCYNSLFSRSPP